MKKILYLFITILIIFILLTACINDNRKIENETNLNISKIIDINYENSIAVVTSKVTADSFEFLIENVSPEEIEIPSIFMSIIKEKEDKLLVAISTMNSVNTGDVLLTIKTDKFNIEKIDYFSRNALTKQYEDFDPYNWKWGGLLGDFNLNGEVELTDFSSFVYYYGMEPWQEDVPEEFSRFDIGPALNIVDKGNWQYVYDYKLEDWHVNIIDFSIFTANYGYNILESPSGTIVLNSNTDISSVTTPVYNDILTVLDQLPDEIHTINSILYTHSDYIDSLIFAISNEDFQGFISNLINIPQALEDSLIDIIGDIGIFANKLSINSYLDENIKWEINDFDWNGDGIIDNDTELHIEATVTYYGEAPQRGSFGLYTDILLESENIKDIEFIGIDNTSPGDAIFDWEFLTKKVAYEDISTYMPIFDENDYLIVDEGLISLMAFIFNNAYIQGNALSLYDLNNPSATITSILQSDSPDASFMELFFNLAEDYTITASELEDNIFGNMLKARDIDFETRIASIQNTIISQNDVILLGLEDSIIDYLPQEHDITSGPFEIFNIWDIYDSNLSNLFISDINVPAHLFGPIMVYPAVFFENPQDFADLGIYLPDITLEGILESATPEIATIMVDFPDPHFSDLISGIVNPLIIEIPEIMPSPPGEAKIIDFQLEGITRNSIPDYGYVYPLIWLRAKCQVSNPDAVSYISLWKGNETIMELYRDFENPEFFFNEISDDISNKIYYENSDYTIELYDFNDNVLDSDSIFLGEFYPEDTLEVTSPQNYYVYNSGEDITIEWLFNNSYHEGAEINLFKFDETMEDINWMNRVKIADDYEINNFSIEDGTFTIPSTEFDGPGLYVIEVALYNWSDNTSFEYQILIEVE